jgi:scyllo-inositol 2-dehydrogenase (NADP+)
MSKIYKLGIVGFGGQGNWHRELTETIDGIEVAGIYDIKEERRQYARGNGIKVYDSYEEMIADPSVDIILIATPNDSHKDYAIRSMRAGKAVVCEKPVAMSSAEFQEIIDVSNETGRLFVVHQNRRWDRDYLTMKNIYESGTLGDVFRIENRVHGSRGIPGDWRQYPEHGGGMVLDWGVHILDQMVLLVNRKIKKVNCRLDHVTNELCDDGFSINLTFEGGLTALLEVGTSNFISLPRWYMLGRDGSAVIRSWNVEDGTIVKAHSIDNKDIVPVYTASGITKTMAPRRPDTIYEEPLPIPESDIRDFYRNVMDTLDGKAEIIVKNDQVMRVMRLMEAAFESARLQQTVDFE